MSIQGSTFAAVAGPPLGLSTTSDLPEDVQWDRFVGQALGGDVLQTTAWADLFDPVNAGDVRVVLRREGRVAGGSHIVVKRLGLLGGIGYIARGPILGDGQADQAESLMDQIHGWCRANRVRHLIVQAGEHAEAIEQALMGRDYIGNAPAVAGKQSMSKRRGVTRMPAVARCLGSVERKGRP